MKISHRLGMSMEVEYGKEKSALLRQNLSKTVKEASIGNFNYNCSTCKLDFRSEVRLLNKVKYCSDGCSGKNRPCTVCGSVVNRISNLKRLNVFCCKKCYYIWAKLNVNPPQNEKRRLNSNSPNAISKRKRTNIDRGLWLDASQFLDGLGYKKYVDQVRLLTKSLRPKIYENWNGFDYYDGEYIRDNFEKFHYTSGEFPSIDHKVSCFMGFQNKCPPEKICELANMVVTKKRINSMKQRRGADDFKVYLATQKLTGV